MKLYDQGEQLKRIADALELVIQMVKKDQEETKARFEERWDKEDQEESKKKWKYEPNEDGFMGSENRIEDE